MIVTALRAVADDVDARVSVTTLDAHRWPTEEQRAAKVAKIKAVAQDIRALANDAERRTVRYAEFNTLKDRLYAFGLGLTPRLIEKVATAFRDVEGPVKPREKRWWTGA